MLRLVSSGPCFALRFGLALGFALGFAGPTSLALHAQDSPASGGGAAAGSSAAGATARMLPPPPDSRADNLEDGLALQGYDPVAYFPEGGGKAAKGAAGTEVTLHGASYRFASEAHQKLFEQDPGRYVPAYGGWCAYAMADGEKVEVDPESFLVTDGRLLVFYKGLFNDTRASWLEQPAALERKADDAWRKLTGQAPRGDKALAELAAAGATRGGTEAQDGAAASAGAGLPAAGADSAADIGSQVGQLAPPFTLKDPAGVGHSLADWRGKLVVLDFWATWCGPCKLAMPGVQKLHDAYKDRDVVVVGIDGFERDPQADPAGYMAGKRYTYQLLLGGEALEKSYAIEGLPTFLVIGRDGRIVVRHVGVPKDPDELAHAVETQLAKEAAGAGG